MPGLTATKRAEGKLTGLARLHVKAKQDRSMRFSNLLHHIIPEMMEKAHKSLNRQSARGVDQQSSEQYGRELSARFLDLHQRIHTGQYKPQPVLRLWLPKPNGEKRPIGITTVEDKVVQQAMVWVLEAIYEADFLGFSYGFRPKRNQHMALDTVYVAISQRKVS
jgi:RNA-directed DNA polymerase